MLTPKVEQMPPFTVEFLRIVRGVESVRLQCEGCKAVQIASWAELGLPDDSPFPPARMIWKCGMCGGMDITVTLEQPPGRKPESETPIAPPTLPVPGSPVTIDDGAISPDLRDRLESLMARLGKAEG